MAYKKTPQKPRKPRSSVHQGCSKKRSLLKERIRTLEERVDELTGKIQSVELISSIYKDDLQLVIEAVGLRHLFDPFGADLDPTPEDALSLELARRKGRHMSSPP